MNPNEIPMRLSWLNVNFKGLTYGANNPAQLTNEDLLALYKAARQKAEAPMDKIIKEATAEYGENVRSLFLFEGLYGTYQTVPVTKLCFDESHESFGLFHGVAIKRGDSLTEFYHHHQDHPEIKRAVDFIDPRRAFFNQYIPIVVLKFGDTFEVLHGNHRAFCAIKNNEAIIPALLVSKNEPPRPVRSFDFKLS